MGTSRRLGAGGRGRFGKATETLRFVLGQASPNAKVGKQLSQRVAGREEGGRREGGSGGAAAGAAVRGAGTGGGGGGVAGPAAPRSPQRIAPVPPLGSSSPSPGRADSTFPNFEMPNHVIAVAGGCLRICDS